MARNSNGAFGKFLNFIGLVDEVEPRDSYGEEYTNGNYGRASTYVPQRQGGAAQSRTAAPARRSLPAQGGRSNVGPRTYGVAEEEYRVPNRRSAAPQDEYQENYGESARANRAPARPRSRFEEEEPQQQPRRQENLPAPRMRVSPRPRTDMCSLHSLEDCCEVIDKLIAGNTIVLTMDELDGYLMQRAVDTLSGAVFALHATIRKASDKTYLIAPMGVEVNETYDVDRRF
jgi:FtsZ-interacting cell division protein YlmF